MNSDTIYAVDAERQISAEKSHVAAMLLKSSNICALEMVGFAFFVFFSRELFGTSSLGHPESISSVGTKKSCTHVWHGPFKVLVIKLCNREGGLRMVTSLYLVKYIRFRPNTQRFPCVLRY